ncbi:hypothetical protein [Elizabethkingia miricola]|uniref:hypothetical protein n=1 Tax=Elizabethkingia miricola TaxID=172045 RepID=UPI0021CCF120|nr:hypothetical protein [Elizabethkingia miricola]
MQNDKMKYRSDLKSVYFQIADHIMEVLLPVQIEIDRCLPSFVDFITQEPFETAKISIQLELDSAPKSIGETKLLSDVSIVWGGTDSVLKNLQKIISLLFRASRRAENGKCLVPKILVNLKSIY